MTKKILKKRIMAAVTAITIGACLLAGCGKDTAGDGDDKTGASALADTAKVDNAIKNASVAEDTNGYIYTGEGPITSEGGTIRIMAQKSNYSNVDITKAPIVLKVFEEAGVDVEWELYDYDKYASIAEPIISSGETDADIIKVPDNDPNQVFIKTGLFVPLDEFFDYMPNYTRWLSENPVEKAELTAEDGHIYYVPGLNVADDYQPCLMYDQVWLDNAGQKDSATSQ